MTCYCGDTECPSCGPAQGFHKDDGIGSAIRRTSREKRKMVALLCKWLSFDHPSIATPDKLSQILYKVTDCGAWLNYGADFVQIGSIVEGCDADVPTRTLHWPFETQDLEDAVADVELDADIMWHECNDDMEVLDDNNS